jgi:hypothetical protein
MMIPLWSREENESNNTLGADKETDGKTIPI